MPELDALGGQIASIYGSLRTLGIDTQALQVTAAAFQAIGGTAQVVRGLIAAKEAYNAVRLAEGSANLLKYGPAALVVAPLALAGGYAMGEWIERTVDVDDGGAGLRAIQGAV